MTAPARPARPRPLADPAVADHLAYLRMRGQSMTTIAGRAHVLRDLAAFAGGPPSRLTAQELCAWRASLTISPDTIAVYVSHVRAFYRWAEQSGKVRRNPATWLPAPPRSRRLPRPIGEAQLADALRHAPPAIRLMLALAGWLGLRCIELSRLRWDEISLQTRTATVHGKGGKERLMPLSDWLIGELRRYGLRPSGYVFARLDGRPGPVAPHRISQMIRRYLRDQGTDATAHQLRHRFATQALRACHDLRVVQELMGHACVQSTQIYTAWDRPTATAAIDNIPLPIGDEP